ncbi:hypothetical protein [Kitasatospora sp. DSM 101779]|uniref:hypothetical protein n=1 Tax=Kitasatospora sp. DSM 101779 TaxID=2853165 RepID=UPI0021D8707D|nr:hypothetical protein [Kitasatospora sp. DSM 101779]MCU7820265.1 hypothetical protein [Kitasatospora sp. DSM 101779]
MDEGFFDAGRLYRRSGPAGRQQLFLVLHVARPPGGFAAPGRDGPVAFGWRRTTTPDGRSKPLGPYNTHVRNGWQDVTDSDLARVLGLTDTGSDGWRSATASRAPASTTSRRGGRRTTDPSEIQVAEPGRLARLLHRHRPDRPPTPPTDGPP